MASTCLASAALAQSAAAPVDGDGYAVESLGPLDESAFDDTNAAAALPALTQNELEDLVGPIALYPDDLLAIVLPATTYPLQIVQAARFLDDYEQDNSLQPDEEWDESVVALLNYPDVLRMLNEDIDWTWQLGEAVIAQQADVISAVETFRDRAYVAGNLKSDEYQNVVMDDGIIEIVPIEDDVIYVPYYDPVQVVVEQPVRQYYYYPRPYPVYYYPYPAGYNFATGYFWGVTTAFQIGWASQHLHVHHPSYWGHPFYGHHYYAHYYRRPSITVYNTLYVNNSRYRNDNRYRYGDYWRPNRRTGSRQSDYYQHSRHYRSDYRADLRPDARAQASGTRDSVRERNRANARVLAGATSARDRQQDDPNSRPVMRSQNDGARAAVRSQPRAAERAPSSQRQATTPGTERRDVRRVRPAATQTPPVAQRVTPRESTRVTPRDSTRVSPRDSTRVTPRDSTRFTPRDASRVAPRVVTPAATAARSAPKLSERRQSPPTHRAPAVRQVTPRPSVSSPPQSSASRQSVSRPSVRQPARPAASAARVERQAAPRVETRTGNSSSGNRATATVSRTERKNDRANRRR